VLNAPPPRSPPAPPNYLPAPLSRFPEQLPKLKTNRLVKLRNVNMRPVAPALSVRALPRPDPPRRRPPPAARGTPCARHTPPRGTPSLSAPAPTVLSLFGHLHTRPHPPSRRLLPCPSQGPIDFPDRNPKALTLTFKITKGAATGWDGKTENMLTTDAPYAVKVGRRWRSTRAARRPPQRAPSIGGRPTTAPQ
jgi:hypothetical protein